MQVQVWTAGPSLQGRHAVGGGCQRCSAGGGFLRRHTGGQWRGRAAASELLSCRDVPSAGGRPRPPTVTQSRASGTPHGSSCTAMLQKQEKRLLDIERQHRFSHGPGSPAHTAGLLATTLMCSRVRLVYVQHAVKPGTPQHPLQSAATMPSPGMTLPHDCRSTAPHLERQRPHQCGDGA